MESIVTISIFLKRNRFCTFLNRLLIMNRNRITGARESEHIFTILTDLAFDRLNSYIEITAKACATIKITGISKCKYCFSIVNYIIAKSARPNGNDSVAVILDLNRILGCKLRKIVLQHYIPFIGINRPNNILFQRIRECQFE